MTWHWWAKMGLIFIGALLLASQRVPFVPGCLIALTYTAFGALTWREERERP